MCKLIENLVNSTLTILFAQKLFTHFENTTTPLLPQFNSSAIPLLEYKTVPLLEYKPDYINNIQNIIQKQQMKIPIK